MNEIMTNLVEMSGIHRGVKAQTPEGLMLQGLALLLTRETPDLYGDIAAFHQKFNLHPVSTRPADLPKDLKEFRLVTLREEVTEYEDAEELKDKLDALVDLVYFALGTAYIHGFNFNEAWKRVHAANMKKVRAEKKGDSKRKSTFDVVKPAGWIAPDLSDLV